MIIRLLVSIPLLILFGFAISLQFLHHLSLFIVIYVISIISTVEYNRIILKTLKNPYEYKKYLGPLLYLFNSGLFIISYLLFKSNRKLFHNFFIIYTLAVIIYAVFILVVRRCGLRNIFYFISGFFYTGLIPLGIVYTGVLERGNLYLYLLFLIVWINDASALYIGSKFGKIKGVVSYSPNKSLEGYIGSTIVTLIFTLLFKVLVFRNSCFSALEIVIIALVLSGAGHAGDILESALKRKAGIKDSSSLFPGLGGMLDVFDSVYASVPFYLLFIKIFCF